MNQSTPPRRVSDVARIAGITVRTLHHYDEIGLLSPRRRSAAGYRLYGDDDMTRLQEVLFFRELGFPLEEIGQLLDAPQHDRGQTLRTQRMLLQEQLERLSSMVGAIDRALDAHEGGNTMNDDDMFEVFGDFNPKDYEAEAEARWSGELMDESKRRTTNYSKEQWKVIMAEAEGISRDFAAAMTAGALADSADATAIAERHRRHIDRWFYPCAVEVHQGLGEMYVADERFAAYWNAFAPDLATFVRNAIAANAGAGNRDRG